MFPEGTVPLRQFFFAGYDDRKKILDIEQWGDVIWYNMGWAFSGCENLNISALDAPDLSETRSLEGMFSGCTSLNADINHWDVGNIESMTALFSGASSFNKPLNNWDVRNVEITHGMFNQAISFNQSLENWNLSNLKVAYYMFTGTSISCRNYSKTLIGWAENPDFPANIDLVSVHGMYYGPDADAARIYLTVTKGWIFNGDVYDPYCVDVYDQNCNDNIVHSGSAVPTGMYKTNKTIQSTANLTKRTYYHAGQSITLTDGFKVDGGEVFEAKIKGCDE